MITDVNYYEIGSTKKTVMNSFIFESDNQQSESVS